MVTRLLLTTLLHRRQQRRIGRAARAFLEGGGTPDQLDDLIAALSHEQQSLLLLAGQISAEATDLAIQGLLLVTTRSARIAEKTLANEPRLQTGLRVILESLLLTVPYVSGRLYRSMRVAQTPSGVRIEFLAPYANRVNLTSKRNSRYAQRGTRNGIRRANQLITSFAWRLLNVQRRRNGGLSINLAFTYRGSPEEGLR